MDFLNNKSLLILFGIVFYCIGCASSNDVIEVNVKVLSHRTQEPMADIKVTVLEKVPLFSFRKSKKVLISKTDSLGFFSFESKRNKTYSLWLEDEKNNGFTIESLVVDDSISDTIIYDINLN